MKERFRQLLHVSAAVLATATIVASAAPAQQQTLQKGQQPGPRFMVPILKAADPVLGVQLADNLRDRMGGDFLGRTLYIVPRNDIVSTLENSGYSVKEALNSQDVKQLAVLVRAEEYLEGSLAKDGAGYAFDGFAYLVRPDGMIQPLPHLSAPKLDALSKLISAEVEKSRRQIDGAKQCMTAWRENKYDVAVAGAQKAMRAYPTSVYARVCLMEIAVSKKLPPDSVVAASEEVRKLHPQNRRAVALAAEAYRAKGDTTNLISSLTTLVTLDPTNGRVIEDLITVLARSNRAEAAIPIVKAQLEQSPGDPNALRLAYAVYRTAQKWKDAAAAGEELVKADTAAADTTFFFRQIAVYQQDSNATKAYETANRGTTKFPKNTSLWVARAQTARRAGQAQDAIVSIKKALELDPKTPGGWLQVAQAFVEQNQPDSVLDALKQALASGDDKVMVGGFATKQGDEFRKKYTASHAMPDAETSLKYLNFAVTTAPSVESFFLRGVVNLTLGQALVTEARTAKNCDMAKKGNDALVSAQLDLPKGGAKFPDQTKQALEGLSQLLPFGDQVQKSVCK